MAISNSAKYRLNRGIVLLKDSLGDELQASQKSVDASADGLNVLKTARATIDASSTLAVGAHGLGVTLPDNAIIVDGRLDIVTAFVSIGGVGTLALDSEGAGDLLAAVDADTLSGVYKTIPVGTAATAIKMTSANELTATVATAALVAGVAVLFVDYVISE